jgi:RNA polymerase sigma-70 factor (ECF subfamily)
MVIQWEAARDMIPEDTREERGARLLASGQSGVIRLQSVREESVSDQGVDAAMDRYAAGDTRAFSELYDLLAPRLYGYLLRKTRNQAEAEDLLQKTMLRIHCARGRFIRGAQVMPWAISIARRLLVDEIRRGKFECSAELEENLELQRTLESIDCPADDLLHAKQVAQMVQQELAKLPEAQRAAFELVKQDGLSHAEAAQVLGTTVTAIKLRAHRTYVALRAALNNLQEMSEA